MKSFGAGEAVVIMKADQPVAELQSLAAAQPQFGSCKDMLTVVVEDDEHLEDFNAYMP